MESKPKSSGPTSHPNNPLHGVTLQRMLETLVETLGWPRMFQAVQIRCFLNKPTIKSSLVFLRRTPWARAEVEKLYLAGVRRGGEAKRPRPAGGSGKDARRRGHGGETGGPT